MIVTGEINEVRMARWSDPHLSWGLIPTMGYLHAGHLSLVERAQSENQMVAVTIYVNPTQFAAGEDLSSYPRNLESDLNLLRKNGVDLVFVPTDDVMYPVGFQTSVTVSGVSLRLEGETRPTHFQGVTTVVTKLFNIVQPQRAYFGQKDAQQTVVLRQMARDLNFNLEIIICPTVRESDGMAMSSRNSYLSAVERQAAPVLYRALNRAESAFEQGERDGAALRQIMRSTIGEEPLTRIDYVSVANPLTLRELDHIQDSALLSMAIYIGETRLIDNMLIELRAQ